ncbi:MAG: DUF89 family protein [Syntrophomonadaceae bacterium]|nr:DUF89 family protein [Syntrophomonadaceae bacterium]
MELSVECIGCLVNQAVGLVNTHLDNEDSRRGWMKKILLEIAASEDNSSAPYIAHKIHRVLKEALQNPDLYREVKLYYNSEMLKLEKEFAGLIGAGDERLETALKLAAAGNIIDYGPRQDLSRDEVLAVISQTLEKEFDRETFASLRSDLQVAGNLLYLGDNAGEIVFDKIFISTITSEYPNLNVDFAARGGPILNDVTEEDAYFVGMNSHARIINNGIDIPGTVLEHCSDSFQRAFDNADVIIAKGQGNFESLYGTGRSNLYYIFLCKCDLFVERCGALPNDIMLMKE